MALRLRQPLWIVFAVALAAVPWAFVAHTLQKATPVDATHQRPDAIVWADRVFASPNELAAWLRSRGASYSAWLAHHPQGGADLAPGSEPPPTTSRPAQTTERPTAAPKPKPVAATSGGGLVRALLEVLAALVVVLLVLLAAAPERLLGLLRPEWRASPVEVRVAAFAAALSISAGALVAQFVG